MKKLFVGLFVSLFVLGSAFARADTIYEQLPALELAASSSTLNVVGYTPPTYISADDFELATNETITDIHWWGFSISGGNDFQFTFYEDSAGSPGSSLLTTGGSLSIDNTALVFPITPPYDVSYYSSFLDTPFNAQANTAYWLSIFNSAADASWVWLSTGYTNVTGNSYRQMEVGTGNWDAPNNDDLAFRLTDDANPIPEPTTMLLLGTGLVGVAGAARRKKKNQV